MNHTSAARTLGGSALNRLAEYVLQYLHQETDATWSLTTGPIGTAFAIEFPDGSVPAYLSLAYEGDVSRYYEVGRAAATALGTLGAHDLRLSGTATRRQVASLEDALPHGRIVAYFQPIVDLRTTGIVAIEALARWQTADGVLTPDSFLGKFDSSDLMCQLFDRMLDSGLHFVAEYRHRLPDLSVAVNFEFAAVPDHGLANLVSRRLTENGVPADQVTIELNDRIAYSLTPDALATLRAVADLGVQLVLDDIATTFESMERLPGVPIAGAKLDRHHVKQIATGVHEQEVVRAMLERAAEAGIEVIAEGVETQAQCDRLVALGCNFGQGYLFAVPQPASSLASMLDAPLMNSW